MIVRLLLILLGAPVLLATYRYQAGSPGLFLRQFQLEHQIANEILRRLEADRILTSAYFGQPSPISTIAGDRDINCNSSPWHVTEDGRILRCDSTKLASASSALVEEKVKTPVHVLLPGLPSIGLTIMDSARLPEVTSAVAHNNNDQLLVSEVQETPEKHSSDIESGHLVQHQSIKPILKPLKLKPLLLKPLKPLALPIHKPLIVKPLVHKPIHKPLLVKPLVHKPIHKPIKIKPLVHKPIIKPILKPISITPVIKPHKLPSVHAGLLHLTIKKPVLLNIPLMPQQHVDTVDKFAQFHQPGHDALYLGVKENAGQREDTPNPTFSSTAPHLWSLYTVVPFERPYIASPESVKESQSEASNDGVDEYGEAVKEDKSESVLAPTDSVPESTVVKPVEEIVEKLVPTTQQSVISFLQNLTTPVIATPPTDVTNTDARQPLPAETVKVNDFIEERQIPTQLPDILSSSVQPKAASELPEVEQTTIGQHVFEPWHPENPSKSDETEKMAPLVKDDYQTETTLPLDIFSSTDLPKDDEEPAIRGDISPDGQYDEQTGLDEGPDVIEYAQQEEQEDHLRTGRQATSIPLDILHEHPRSATILDGSALINIMAALREQYLKNAEPDQRKLIEEAFDRLQCSVRDMKKLDERPTGKKIDGSKKAALELLAERGEPEESDYYSDATDDVSSEPSFLELLNVATKHKFKQSEDAD